jgi:proline iminopeptidase
LLNISVSISLSHIISLLLSIATLVAGPVPKVSAIETQAAQTALTVGIHTAPLGEVDIGYRVAGEGPILIAVSPQWGIGSLYLANGISRLEGHFKVVYVDARGSGRSSRPDDPTHMSTSSMVEDLEHLRKYWGLPTLSVLGHSGGGAIALGFAERYPDHAQKIVLVDAEVTDLYPSPDSDRIISEWKHDPEHASWTIHINDRIRDDRTFTHNLLQTLGLYLYHPSQTAKDFLATLPPYVSYWAESNWERDDKLSPMPQSRDFGKVTASSLIIVGRHDFVCPVGMSEQIHQGIHGSQLAIFEKTGHIPWIEEPEKFFSLVTQFLDA